MLPEKIKKKSLGLYILILLNLLLLPFYSTRAQDVEGGIISALNSLDVTIEEINVNAHVSIEDEFLNSFDAGNKAIEISDKLSLKTYTIDDYSTWDNTQIVLRGTSEELHQITVIVQATDIPEVTETNIVVDFVTQNNFVDLATLEKRIQEVLDSYGVIDFNSNITASHEDKLSIPEQKEIIGSLMNKLDAKEVETFTDENMVSVTGYSNLIERWKQYGGNKVNLHVATRYNSFEDKTNLWLGTPFITIGY